MVGQVCRTLGAWAFVLSAVNALPNTPNIRPRLVGDALKTGRATIPAVKLHPRDINPRWTSTVDVSAK